MTDKINVNSDGKSPPGDATSDQAHDSKAQANATAQPLLVPAVTKMKKGSPPPKATGGGNRRGFVSTIPFVVWSGLKLLGKVIWKAVKFTTWTIPRHAFGAFRGIKSKRLRRATALGAVLLIGVGAYFLWPTEPKSTRQNSSHMQ